jgi:hypothetical protein
VRPVTIALKVRATLTGHRRSGSGEHDLALARQLLDDPHPEPAQPADNGMPPPVRALARHRTSMPHLATFPPNFTFYPQRAVAHP